MKKFQFRLDNVMKVYKLHQDNAQIALQDRIAIDNKAKQKLTEYEQNLKNSTDVMENKSKEVNSVADLLHHRVYLNRLNEQLDGQKKVCIESQKEVQQAREILIAASRRTQTIENLKGKQYRQYCENVLKEEQVEMDEMAQRLKNKL